MTSIFYDIIIFGFLSIFSGKVSVHFLSLSVASIGSLLITIGLEIPQPLRAIQVIITITVVLLNAIPPIVAKIRKSSLDQFQIDDITCCYADWIITILLLISSFAAYSFRNSEFQYYNPEPYGILGIFTPGVWVFILCLLAIIVSRFLSIISRDDPSIQRPYDFGPKTLKGRSLARQFGIIFFMLLSVGLYLPLIFSDTSALGISVSILLCLGTQVITTNIINGFGTIILTLNILWIGFFSVYLDVVTTASNIKKLMALSAAGLSIWLPILATIVPAYLQLKIVWDRTDWSVSEQHRRARFLSLNILTFVFVSIVCIALILIPIWWQFVPITDNQIFR